MSSKRTHRRFVWRKQERSKRLSGFENLHKLRIKDDLSKKYSVRGIPALIVLDGESGNVVTMNGRGQYTSYFKGEYSTGSNGCVVS